MDYRIRELAAMTGVTVRTLHHYDRIGLLRPLRDPVSGYRLYNPEDKEQLEKILLYRELGFALGEIIPCLDDRSPACERLEQHRRLLDAKRDRLTRIIEWVVQLERGEEIMTLKTRAAFNMEEIEKHQSTYREEVRQKYDPEVVAESERRTARYSEADWQRVQAEGDRILGELAAGMGRAVEDPEVQQTLETYRQYISDCFYTCTPEIFKGLGGLYITDPRFKRNLDRYEEGFAQYLSEAIAAY